MGLPFPMAVESNESTMYVNVALKEEMSYLKSGLCRIPERRTRCGIQLPQKEGIKDGGWSTGAKRELTGAKLLEFEYLRLYSA
jgi:hypothetical protein